MRLWCDVYSAAGARLGEGPVNLRSAAVTRVLDGVGSFRLSVPGRDARARSLLINERHIRIYYKATGKAPTRELGRGVVRHVAASGDPGDWSLDVDGPDDLDGLTRITTKLRQQYSAQTVSAIVTSLVGMVSGWSATASGGNTTDARFDGMSIFKALLGLAEQQGLHVRTGTSPKTVEVGAFGSAAGLRLINPAQAHPSIEGNDEITLIESIHYEQDTEGIYTRLYPLGAGIGEAWLTIEKATHNLPYTRQVANINAIDQHFLEDFEAVALYGVIEKMGRFPQIAPLSNSVADQENGANALYDISAAWLQRYSKPLETYRVTARKVRKLVRPGDKVRLVYNDVVTQDGEVVHYLDVDEDLWVSEVTERVGVEGAALDLVLVNVDRHAQDAARIVIGALEELQIDGVTVKPYFNRAPAIHDMLIDPFHPAIAPVTFTNATQRLNRCLLRITTSPFVSTTRATLINAEGHRHVFLETGDEPPSGPYYWREVYFRNSVTGTNQWMLVPLSTDATNVELVTQSEDDPDYLSVEYGLQSDTQTPDTLSLWVNGVDYTSALGGPWQAGGGGGVFTLDITSAILNYTLQQEHLIELRCVSGQGAVNFQFDIYETIQSIAVT